MPYNFFGVVNSKNELGIETRTGGSQKDSMRFLEKLYFNTFQGRNIYSRLTAVANHVCCLSLEQETSLYQIRPVIRSCILVEFF